MLTTIPQKQFVELIKGVKETQAKKPFNWKEMLDNAQKYTDLMTYMRFTNCKFIGEGSSRIAYFLPVGDYDAELLNVPACFKVAKNEKGIAQNHVEIEMLQKYQDKFDCFPKIYDWDGDNDFFMLCEVGTPINGIEIDQIRYFADWISFGKEFYEKHKDEYASFHSEEMEEIEDAFYHWDKTFKLAVKAINLCRNAYLEMLKYPNRKELKDKFYLIKQFINELSVKYKKYAGVKAFLDFACRGDGEMEVEDFDDSDNWGYVYRDGEYVLMPIDWGFSKEVAQKYY